jgi:hypothetical protein
METRTAGSDSVPPGQPHPKAVLLGLPCADCKAYFAAHLEVCPICGCNERVVIGKGAMKVPDRLKGASSETSRGLRCWASQ